MARKRPAQPLESLMQPVGVDPSGVLVGATPLTEQPARSKRRIIKRIILSLVLLVIMAGGLFAWSLYSDIAKLTGDKNPLNILNSFVPVELQKTNGRTNVLITGYSADDPGHAGAMLTDSIMVLSIDTANKSALVFNVPRDLYVDIPGYGSAKINEAYQYGERVKWSQDGYDKGGMGVLESLISDKFDLDIHYYALINYTAFRDAINAVGGVTIDLTSPDNPNGLYDPFVKIKLPNGVVTLNGQQALNLARARGDGPGSYGFPRSDFNRTRHQQQILVALKEKAASASTLSNPFKIANLADAAGNNVKTNMSTREIQTLFQKTKVIPSKSIKTITLNDVNGKNLLRSYTTPRGQSALIPAAGMNNYDVIQSTLEALLRPTSPANQ